MGSAHAVDLILEDTEETHKHPFPSSLHFYSTLKLALGRHRKTEINVTVLTGCPCLLCSRCPSTARGKRNKEGSSCGCSFPRSLQLNGYLVHLPFHKPRRVGTRRSVFVQAMLGFHFFLTFSPIELSILPHTFIYSLQATIDAPFSFLGKQGEERELRLAWCLLTHCAPPRLLFPLNPSF